MTREETIDMCMEIRDYLTSGNPIWDKDKVGEALDMAIEALKKDETTLHVSGVSPDRIVRPIDPTITVDLESGVVPRTALAINDITKWRTWSHTYDNACMDGERSEE